MSLKVNDLRFGNYVYFSEKIVIVKDIHSQGFIETSHFPFGFIDVSRLNGILITEEIIKNIPFKKSNIDSFYFIELNDWSRIYVNFINGMPLVEVSISKHSYNTKIYYIHELQNLYFSMTLKELIIKLC